MHIDWRGSASGGTITNKNHAHFPRFILAHLASQNTDLIDAAITDINRANCWYSTDCNLKTISQAYNITGKRWPREQGYEYKYLLDIDGNSYSGRYLGLLRTNALVFKVRRVLAFFLFLGTYCKDSLAPQSTAFSEFFDPWLRPYEHFIPVAPDLSDLVSKIEWARAHDDEAKQIAQAGREVAERVMTDAQNDCYYFAVLLEWGRLWGEG